MFLLFWLRFSKCLCCVGVFYQNLSVVEIWKYDFFSSPEHNVLRASYCDLSLSGIHLSVCPSVREQLLKKSSLKAANRFQWKFTSLSDALSEYFKNFNSMKNSGCHGNRKKKIFLSQTGLELSYLACSII